MASIENDVLLAIQTQLNKITIANGYRTDLGLEGGAQILERDGNDRSDLPVAVMRMPRVDKSDDEGDVIYRAEAEMVIEVTCAEPMHGTDSVDGAIMEVVDDIEHAILKGLDAGTPYLGLAALEDIKLRGHAKNDFTGDNDIGADVYLTVMWRHDKTNPGTLT